MFRCSLCMNSKVIVISFVSGRVAALAPALQSLHNRSCDNSRHILPARQVFTQFTLIAEMIYATVLLYRWNIRLSLMGRMKNSLQLKVPPPLLFLCFGGLIRLLAALAPWASVGMPAKNIIAAVIAAFAGLLAVPSIIAFLRAKTTLHPEDPSKTTKLVVTGTYAISRNPMYLSLLLLLIAWTAYLANIAAAAPLPFFVAYLNRFQIKPEERALASRFGSEYETYRRRVRRWL